MNRCSFACWPRIAVPSQVQRFLVRSRLALPAEACRDVSCPVTSRPALSRLASHVWTSRAFACRASLGPALPAMSGRVTPGLGASRLVKPAMPSRVPSRRVTPSPARLATPRLASPSLAGPCLFNCDGGWLCQPSLSWSGLAGPRSVTVGLARLVLSRLVVPGPVATCRAMPAAPCRVASCRVQSSRVKSRLASRVSSCPVKLCLVRSGTVWPCQPGHAFPCPALPGLVEPAVPCLVVPGLCTPS